MDQIDYITHLQAVTLQPGDVIVARTDKAVSDETAARLVCFIEGKFPGHEVLVLGSVELGVITNVDRLGAIERKLDQLLASLAADEEEEPRFALDGQPAGAERDGNQSLG
jgi:hypothetical protein